MLQPCWLLLLLCAAAANGHPVQQDIVEAVRASGANWLPLEPSFNPFSSWSDAQIRALMGTKLDPPPPSPSPPFPPIVEGGVRFPESFDARQNFSSCQHPILNQLHCGSCWAFATAETWADNACVLGLAPALEVFSPQEVVSCATFMSEGCHGGYIPYAWDFVTSDGLVSQECMPYTAGNGTVKPCPTEKGPGGERTCTSVGVNWNATKCAGKANMLWNTDLIKEGVMKLGAATTGFFVYEDFMNYKSGVYKHVTGKKLGGHAIKIIGWGADNNNQTAGPEEYWLVANSWGDKWGMDGYFKFSMQDEDCAFAHSGAYNCGAPITPPSSPNA